MSLVQNQRERGAVRDRTDPSRTVEVALPMGSAFSAIDLEHLLRGWATGDPDSTGPYVLPAGLRWSGPLPGPADECVAGHPVFSLSWDRPPEPVTPEVAEPGPEPAPEDIYLGEWAAAVAHARWMYSATGDLDSDDAGARTYAVAAASGIARRAGGLLRVAEQGWRSPGDAEATWSVYLAARPRADRVVGALRDVLPGIHEMRTDAPTWMLDAADGRGLWLEKVVLDGVETWDDYGDPAWAAVGALVSLGSPSLWAIRIEGAEDTVDDVAREGLDAIARACAAALGGIAVDSEGFLVASPAEPLV